MVDIKTLLPELRDLVRELAEDLLARSTEDKQIDAGLRDAFQQIEKGGRTAQAFEVWRDDYLDQVAVAWVLACVFVRFLEDNHLIDECWLAGEGQRRRLAEDTHELFFRAHPHDTDREYFQHAFREVGKIPAARDLFAEGKTPLWAVGISGDAAMSLLKFWREIDAETGLLRRSCEVENGDTRFLGDLYQELSERAKKKYALLQTPIFVEEFILDRTLTPAIHEFGLEVVRMLDPTCGSGHFLLGGFDRLFREWSKPEHTTGNDRTDAQKALDGVWGVDINPFAVAIARFRLLVAAAQMCDIQQLKDAPGWSIHLVTGDSLLFGSRWNSDGTKRAEPRYFDDSWAPAIYVCEEKVGVNEVLGQQYHVVVGNPPYIRPDDPARSDAYRSRFPTAHGKYTLAVPFFERFFDLCLSRSVAREAGYVGFITSGGFMKADFGRSLVQTFLPRIDLTHVLDTANVPLPGHGTNTIIAFGRNRTPSSDKVRVVRGIAGESPPPTEPATSKVWASIVAHVDVCGHEDTFISVVDDERTLLCTHPWSISGGGTLALKSRIEEVRHSTLDQIATDVGIGFVTLLDEVFQLSFHSARRLGIPNSNIAPITKGQDFREWIRFGHSFAIFPYEWSDASKSFTPCLEQPARMFLWRFRTHLWNRKWFKKTQRERGLKWWEYGHISCDKRVTRETIFWGEISTHNHFGIDTSAVMGDQTAPMIKLPAPFSVDYASDIAAILNSSLACFWLKEVCRPKGGDHVGTEGARVRKLLWDERYAFSSRRVQKFPFPKDARNLFGRKLQAEASALSRLLSGLIKQEEAFQQDGLESCGCVFAETIARMRFLQEESDWECYYLYGLLEESLTYDDGPTLGINFGHRAFEIVMARRNGDKNAWFERHKASPTTTMPQEWPDAYRRIVAKRIDAIEHNQSINLLERADYKRRWNVSSWSDVTNEVLRKWLLNRLESERYWGTRGSGSSTLKSVAQLADIASGDQEFLQVAALLRGRLDFDVYALTHQLIADESVPFLPTLIFSDSGVRKRKLWERTWAMQRQEDAEHRELEVEEPPEFEKKDFASITSWNMRGKLDVPQERWVSYPFCSTESDPTLLVGWAGWNYLEQATALINYYDARKREGWDAKRLMPLLAGLDQLLPWIHQWHPEIDPEFGETAGQSYQTMLEQDAHELGLTLDDIRNWQPPEKPRKARASRKKASTAEYGA